MIYIFILYNILTENYTILHRSFNAKIYTIYFIYYTIIYDNNYYFFLFQLLG